MRAVRVQHLEKQREVGVVAAAAPCQRGSTLFCITAPVGPGPKARTAAHERPAAPDLRCAIAH
jgi:hypothetical protein